MNDREKLEYVILKYTEAIRAGWAETEEDTKNEMVHPRSVITYYPTSGTISYEDEDERKAGEEQKRNMELYSEAERQLQEENLIQSEEDRRIDIAAYYERNRNDPYSREMARRWELIDRRRQELRLPIGNPVLERR